MAYPSVRSSSSGAATYSSGWQITAPATIEAGDTIWVTLFAFTGDGTVSVLEPASGWTEKFDTALTADSWNGRFGGYYKKAVGNEDGTTLTIATQATRDVCRYICDVVKDAADPTVTAPAAATPASGVDSTAVNYPSLTPGGGAIDYYWLSVCGNFVGQRSAYPSDCSLNQITTWDSSNEGGLFQAGQQLNAASEDCNNATIGSNGSWVATQVAFYPITLVQVSATAISLQVSVNDKLFVSFDGSDNIARSDYGTAIAGDLQFQAYIRAADYMPAYGQIIGGHWGAAGDKGWSLWLHTDGTLVFGISTDGTNVDWKASTAVLAATDNITDIWVRVTFDANDGAVHNLVKFYTSADGSSWSQLGDTVQTDGVYTIFSPTTAKFAVGAADHEAWSWPDGFNGRIYEAAFYSDQGSTLVANPCFRIAPWAIGRSAEDDAQGNTWTLSGPPIAGMGLGCGGRIAAATVSRAAAVSALQVGGGLTAAAIGRATVVPTPTLQFGWQVEAVSITLLAEIELLAELVTGAGPDPIGSPTAISGVTLQWGGRVTAITVDRSVAISQCAANTSEFINATPISRITTFPGITLQWGGRVSATAVTGMASFPVGTYEGSAQVIFSDASNIDLSVALPVIFVLQWGGGITATAVSRAAAIPVPTGQWGGRVTATAISRAAAVSALQVGGGLTAAAIGRATVVPTPTLRFGWQVEAVSITLLAEIELLAELVTGAGPDPIDTPAAISGATLRWGGEVLVAAMTCPAVEVPSGFQVHDGETVTPESISTDPGASIPLPEVITDFGAQVEPDSFACLAGIPDSTDLSCNVGAGPSTIAAPVSVSAGQVGIKTSVSTISRLVVIPATFTLRYGARLEPLAITLLADVPNLFGVSGGVGPDPVDTVASIPATFTLQYSGKVSPESGIGLATTVSAGKIGSGITLTAIDVAAAVPAAFTLQYSAGLTFDAINLTALIPTTFVLQWGGKLAFETAIDLDVLLSDVTLEYGAGLTFAAINIDAALLLPPHVYCGSILRTHSYVGAP